MSPIMGVSCNQLIVVYCQRLSIFIISFFLFLPFPMFVSHSILSHHSHCCPFLVPFNICLPCSASMPYLYSHHSIINWYLSSPPPLFSLCPPYIVNTLLCNIPRCI